MERSCRLAAILLFAAVSPAVAHTWLIDGKKVDGDFVREGRDQIKSHSGKMQPVAIVVISVGGKDKKYQLSRLSWDDRKYEEGLVKEQKDTADTVEERSWKNKNGKSSEKGRLIGIEGNKVLMLAQRNDWNETRPRAFKDFSPADRDYIRKEMTNRGEGDKVPAEPRPNAHPKPDPSKIAENPNKSDLPKPNPPANPAPSQVQPPAVASTAKPTEPAHPESAKPLVVIPPAVVPSTGHPATEHPPAAHQPTESAHTEHPAPTQIAQAKATAAPPAKTNASPKQPIAAPQSVVSIPPAKSKICTACRNKLPDTIKAGDNCPNCGAYLQFEDTEQGPRLQVSSTFRSLGAPVGLASLCCVIAVAVFRIRSYAQQ